MMTLLFMWLLKYILQNVTWSKYFSVFTSKKWRGNIKEEEILVLIVHELLV